MTESQVELIESIGHAWNQYRALMPEVAAAYDLLPEQVYRDGALSAKIKRLMALVAAIVHGCRACVLFQTERSLEEGATVAEILESCSVAVSLGGTMGAGETTRVVAYLKEIGKI